jgi:hypothetical protein
MSDAYPEWKKRNVELLLKMKVFKEDYHKRVCLRMDEEHVKNGCYEVNGIRYCHGAKLAVERKFKKEIDSQIASLYRFFVLEKRLRKK